MNKSNLFLTLLITVLIGGNAMSQTVAPAPATVDNNYTGWSAIVKGGVSQPYTDLNQFQFYKTWKSKNENRPLFSIGAQKMISNVFGFQAFFNGGTLVGTSRAFTKNTAGKSEDVLYRSNLAAAGITENVYFKTKILSANANIYMDLTNLGYSLMTARTGNYHHKWAVYTFLGLGFVNFDTKIKPLNPNSKKVYDKYLRGVSGNTIESEIPFGVGVKYKINNVFNVGFEYSMHNVMSDKLDGLVLPSSGFLMHLGDNDKYGAAQITLAYNITGSNKKAENIEWANPFDERLNQKPVTAADILKDEDGDGVADMLDKETATPAGCRVDGSGRALDTDGDGVIDCRDRERLSPAGYPVDQYGVAQIPDSDGDGINDDKDWEIHSPVGCKVDAHGVCPVAVASTTPAVSLPSIYFDTDNQIVKKDYIMELQQVALALHANPNMKITITGNTDKHHSDDYNDKLGMRRAKAVADILIKRFDVPADRINLKSNGKRMLNSPNDELNRRVDVSTN